MRDEGGEKEAEGPPGQACRGAEALFKGAGGEWVQKGEHGGSRDSTGVRATGVARAVVSIPHQIKERGTNAWVKEEQGRWGRQAALYSRKHR